MKRLFNIVNLFIVAVLLSVNTVNAQVKLDYENGNIGIDKGNCWGFKDITYIQDQNLKISGTWSGKSKEMTNKSLTNTWIKSPWMKVGQGKIKISTRLDKPDSKDKTRKLVFSYIPFNKTAENEGTPTEFYTYDWPKQGNGGAAYDKSVYDLEITIPDAIANSPDSYKIMFSFVGEEGASSAISDNISIPGEIVSDPLNNCKPKSVKPDADKDGVVDDEDEYDDDITRAYNNYFPSENSGTLAFEDNWPSKGDYDLNDIVVNYKINRVTNAANNVVEVIATFVARASGAGFRDAFGFQLDNIDPNKIVSVTGNKVGKVADVFKFGSNGLESNQTYANIIVFDNFYEVLKHPGSGSFINVTKDAPFVEYVTLTVTIKMQSNIPIVDLPAEKFNFYIVADVLKNGRGKEIHLPDGKPSSLVNSNLFGTFDDNSTGSKYYRTENNLPWGINVVQGFDYMFEKVSIDKGYNYFIKWAESNGADYQDWFEDKAGYRNPENIYKH